MASTRPAKVKRTASSLVTSKLTTVGEDLLSKKRAGEALVVETESDKENAVQREPASSIYAVTEIRGTAGTLIAKLITKKDRTSFFAKQSTILPTGHEVVSIDKDFVVVKIGKDKEMIGFPTAGLLTEKVEEPPAAPAQNVQEAPKQEAPKKRERRRRQLPNNKGGGMVLSGAALAR